MRILITLFILGAFSSTNAQTPKSDVQGDSLYRVSIIKLIANPEKYHGKKVAVTGLLHYRFEDSSLYISSESEKWNISENALWVNYADKVEVNPLKNTPTTLKDLDAKFVSVVGFFDMNNHGHMGSYAGGLKNVSRISEKKQ